jgi:hypothetical protein
MGQEIDADPDRAEFGRGFEYFAGNAGRMQREPERQSANPAADDDDVVHVPPRIYRNAVPAMKHE